MAKNELLTIESEKLIKSSQSLY